MMIQSKEDTIQNLKNAGCSEEQIEDFLGCRVSGSIDKQVRFLRKHRSTLMDALHDSQHKVDCLDYLIYILNKENKEKAKIERS